VKAAGIVLPIGFWLGLLAAACRSSATGGAATSQGNSRAAFPSQGARLVFADVIGRTQEVAYDKRELLKEELEQIVGFDPYYQREKRFWALPLAPLLQRAFSGIPLSDAELVLRAEDGYTVPMEGSKLLDGTAYLALADADHPSTWDRIGPQRADPGGFYLVWKGPDRADLVTYPRPWSLVRIERTRFEAVYPHVAPPPGEWTDAVKAGYSIFRGECIRCHAINREGGHVGPDLNVPQSIVEYRPVEQIKAYIKDPQTFRYGAMPAHPHLEDGDLDALVAYFRVMKTHKHDDEVRK
jgi:mono/diheme cytochrome c family protein